MGRRDKPKLFGDFIRKLRSRIAKEVAKEKGGPVLEYTRQDLAKELGVEVETVGKWESDNSPPGAKPFLEMLRLGKLDPGDCLYLPEDFEDKVAEMLSRHISINEKATKAKDSPETEGKRPPADRAQGAG